MGPIENFHIVYDFQLEDDFLPNCLNLSRADMIFENSGKIEPYILDYYFKYYRQIPVINNNMSVTHSLLNKITISEYLKMPKDDNSVFIYLVEPYANITHILGGENSIDKGKPFLHFASSLSKKELQDPDNNFYLLISFPTEGTLNDEIFKYFYEICAEYGIPNYKLIFVSASYDVEQHHKLFRKTNNKILDTSIKTLHWCWSLREKAQEYYDIIKHSGHRLNIDDSISSVVTEDDLTNKKRNKKFLIFNRRMRGHRVVLMCLLGYDIIKNNYISYDLTKGENDYNLHFFQQGERLPEQYQEGAYENLIKIQQTKQISAIDFEDVHGTIGFGCEVKEPYLDSYIHVVTETNFYEPGLYFSEKTWKPILNFQPFIQVNYTNSLQALKEMGFKTFHPFIDESYDLIEDHTERIVAISNEIKRLDSLSIDEIDAWYNSIKDILIHNRNHALKYRQENEFQINNEQLYIHDIINYVKFNQKNKKIF